MNNKINCPFCDNETLYASKCSHCDKTFTEPCHYCGKELKFYKMKSIANSIYQCYHCKGFYRVWLNYDLLTFKPKQPLLIFLPLYGK
jgi:hypothetical protein